jgi:hypothetical protein
LYTLLKNDFGRLDSKYQELLKSGESHLPRGDRQQVKMLEEENAYLKKNFDVEIALLKDENDILKNQLMQVQSKRNKDKLTPNIRPNTFSSPVRYPDGGATEEVPHFKSS